MTTAHPVTKRWRFAIWSVFVFALLLLLGLRLAAVLRWPELSAPLGPVNPDAWLRLAQLRDWLAADNSFSHAVPRTNAPLGGVEIHWTRPLDVFLWGFYGLTPRNAPVDLRLMIAASLYPVVLCLVTAGLLTAATRKLFRHNHVLACTLLLLGATPYLSSYFSPGDADHHGLLSAIWCGIILLLLDLSRPCWKMLLAGGLLGALIWVSPEGLLLLALVIAMLALETMRRSRSEVKPAAFFLAIGAAVVVTAGVFMETPWKNILARVNYDSLSIVHVYLCWQIALASAGLVAACRRWASISFRMTAGAVIGLASLLALHRAYPRFFLGPFADADPYIFKNFLPFISEARPLLNLPFSQYAPSLLQPVLAMVLAGFAVYQSRSGSLRKLQVLMLAGLLVITLLLTLLQLRWAYYLAPLALILCGGLLPTLSVAARRFSFAPRRWQPYLWIMVIFAYITGTAFAGSKPAGPQQGVACMNEIRFVIQTRQLQPLIGDDDTIFYTYEDVGGEMLFFTPYRIIASNYHREADGLRDLKAMREAPDLDSFHGLLKKRQVGALLICPVYHPALFPPGAKTPGWLEKIGGLEFYQPAGNKPELYRVVD
ncbi:MAG TPA: hypothetical protein VEF76_13480 [Patescibacteria group bacterium]|nr:hypothetical protein [Patescibacteria group bacterium]